MDFEYEGGLMHSTPLATPMAVNTIFIVFGLTRPGIKPKSTTSVADAQSSRPLIDQF